MEAIAAGKGRKPKPFMLHGSKVQADAPSMRERSEIIV